MGITGMNCDALKRRYERSYIVFLVKITVVLIAEFGVENYDKYQAIIDLLTEHSVDVLPSHNLLPTLYKDDEERAGYSGCT